MYLRDRKSDSQQHHFSSSRTSTTMAVPAVLVALALASAYKYYLCCRYLESMSTLTPELHPLLLSIRPAASDHQVGPELSQQRLN